MVRGSSGRVSAIGCGAGLAETSSPARKPASHARCVALAGPTTRLRSSISSSAKGAVLGIGDWDMRMPGIGDSDLTYPYGRTFYKNSIIEDKKE